MSAKILDFPVQNRQKTVLRLLEGQQTAVYSVRCPRKGPLGAEISLVVCGELNDAARDLCAEKGCDAAAYFAKQIAALKSQTKK